MAKKNKGGRKPLPKGEKAILVGFYVREKAVEAWGGIEKLRQDCQIMVNTNPKYQNQFI